MQLPFLKVKWEETQCLLFSSGLCTQAWPLQDFHVRFGPCFAIFLLNMPTRCQAAVAPPTHRYNGGMKNH